MIERIISYVSIFIALLIVLPLHEFAHAFAAVKSGDNTPKVYGRYTINPFAHFDLVGLAFFVLARFGWAKPVPINPKKFKNYRRGCFFTAIAGVTMNYIIAFIAYPLLILVLTKIPDIGYFDDFIKNIFYYTYSLSISFCVFNLLPIYPLDGFRIFALFSSGRSLIYKVLRYYGKYILMVWLFCGILSDFTGIYKLNFLGNTITYLSNIFAKPITLLWNAILI